MHKHSQKRPERLERARIERTKGGPREIHPVLLDRLDQHKTNTGNNNCKGAEMEVGAARSSDEVDVMSMEQRGCTLSYIYIKIEGDPLEIG